MWPFKRNSKPSKKESVTKEPSLVERDQHDDLSWLSVGAGNPFDGPIMDIRSVSLNMVSTTSDPKVAENYTASRNCDGRKYIDANPENVKSYRTEFSYPHNGEELDGIVFKSPAMEIKWDIYAYGEWFYFVRSWTSDLVYKVRYENAGHALIFKEVLANEIASEIEAQNIHSIMLTHVLGRVWPYYVPGHLQDMSNKKLALHMFSQFGSKATILTTDNVFKIGLANKQT